MQVDDFQINLTFLASIDEVWGFDLDAD